MALNVGDLLATFGVDTRPAAQGITRAEAMMHGLQADAEVTGRRIHAGLEEALAELPEIDIDADPSAADREIDALRQRMEVIRDLTIGVDADTEQARTEIDEVRAQLAVLADSHPDIDVQAHVADAITALNVTLADADALNGADPTVTVHANTGDADAQLAATTVLAHHLDGEDPRVDVRVDDHGSATSLMGRMGSLTGSFWSAISASAGFMKWPFLIGAAIPAAAGLAAALVNILPAASIAATGVLALVSAVGAIKLGTGGIGDAFKAAFAPAVSGGGGAAKATNAAADAQRNLQQATANAAWSNKQAVQQVAQAERDLADAQQAALRAQQAVNDARHQAVRDLEDMNNNLVDAKNREKEAEFAVADAAKAVAAARMSGDPQQVARAQLAYDEAVQALKEQRLQVQRLTDDTEAANKAGVEGSKGVTDAKRNEAAAVRDVQDKTQALQNAQESQQRTMQQGLDQIRAAQEALAQAGAAGGGAAGGVNAFAAAMAKLAPNAREFVREVISLKPAWDAMKLDVQQRLFAGLAAALAATATAVLPVLRRGLDSTAGALNGMALGGLAAARNLGRSGVLGTALDGAAAGLRNLIRLPGQVVTAFGQIAAAGAPQFGRLTTAVGQAADRISARLSTAFASGGLSQAIDTAVQYIKEFGVVAGNIGHIIGSVFGAAQQSGGGFLQILMQVTGAMREAFASPAVQSALSAVFQTMSVLGKTVAPLLAQALGVIAPVLTALGPPAQLLIRTLGDALRPIIAALGPVLLAAAGAVGDLVTALAPLLPIVGEMIASLGPVLTPILGMVGLLFRALAPVLLQVGKVLLPPLAKVVGTLATAFKQMAPILSVALEQLGSGLVPIVSALGLVIADLVDQYADQWLNMFQQLLPVLPVLIPVVVQLAQSIAQVLVSIAPLIPQLMLMSTMMIAQLLPAILPLVPPLAQLAILLLRLATDVITGVVVPAIQGLIDFMNGLKKAFQPAIDAVSWLTGTISRLFETLYDHLVGHSVIPDLVREIVRWFAGLPGKALSVLASLPGKIAGVAADAATGMVRAIRKGIGDALSWLGGLGRRAKDAIGDLGGVLWGAGQSLIGGFIDGIGSMFGNVKSTLGDLTSKLTSWKGPADRDAVILHPAGRLVIGGFMDGIASQVPALRRQLGDLTSGLPGMSLAGGRLAGASGLSGGYGGPAGGGEVRVVLDVTGGDDDLKKAIRKWVRLDGGGDVQIAFGRG